MPEDFLVANPEERVKRQVVNICDSYSNPWDILAELAQNSIDAIREWEESYPQRDREHQIDITIGKHNRSIKFEDTGVGIRNSRLPSLLAPNATDKHGDNRTVGEKGVGLTFCIFCSNQFQIETRSEQGEYKGEIHTARTWREGDDADTIPEVQNVEREDSSIDPEEMGTTVVLNDLKMVDNEDSIFRLSPERFEYLLRTKTAIGNTKRHKSDEPDIDVNLTINDGAGEVFSDSIEYGYYYPEKFWEDKNVIDIEEFENRDDIARLSDQQKREKLDGKCWKLDGAINRNGREIRYYGLFVPSPQGWNKVARNNGLYEEDTDESDVKAGIYISTRGMPTGIELTQPETGSSNFWNNVFLLLGYDGFQFDLGRKSIPGATQGMLKDIAREKFLTFRNWRDTVRTSLKTPTTKIPQVSQAQKDEQFRKLEMIQDLNYPDIKFSKQPDTQEAGVVAIFHELIGNGELDNYMCFRTGYNQDYDFWGHYEAAVQELGADVQKEFPNTSTIDKRVVIEFKYDAASIIPDVVDERKYLEDIDLIVCQDIDENRFQESSIVVEPLTEQEVFYTGANYKLMPAQNNRVIGSSLHILSLRRYIEDQKTT